MSGRIHILGSQKPNNNINTAIQLFCPKGDIAVISAGWRYDECELQTLQTLVKRKIRHIPLYEWFDGLGSIEPELAGLHRMRQRRILAYKKTYQIHLDSALESWIQIQKLHRADPTTYQEDESDACKRVQEVDKQCMRRLTTIKNDFAAIGQPWLHETAFPLHQQIAEVLERCSALIITGGHVAILRNRLAFFGLEELLSKFLLDGKQIFAWSAGAMCLTDKIVLFHDSPPWGQGRTEILDSGMGLLPRTVLLPNASSRLDLQNPNRIERLARRFAPNISVCLENGAHLIFTEHGVYDHSAKRSAFQLSVDGTKLALESV
jgi:hypothetical protein